MAKLTRIDVLIITSDADGAGTDGDVYLGICGREFFVDSSADDFERSSSKTYTFGDGSNVNNASMNDPREQNLLEEDADRYPVYIRFEQFGASSPWKLLQARVTLNQNAFPLWETISVVPAQRPDMGIWLGRRAGEIIHIPKHDETI